MSRRSRARLPPSPSWLGCAALLPLLASCGGAPCPPPAATRPAAALAAHPPPEAPAPVGPAEPAAPAPRLAYTLRVASLREPGPIDVEVVASGLTSPRWVATGPVASIGAIDAVGPRGPAELDVARTTERLEVAPRRDVEALRLSYRIDPSRAGDAIELVDGALFVEGRLLLAPRGARDAVPVRLVVEEAGVEVPSLSTGGRRRGDPDARVAPGEIASLALLAGRLDRARFETHEGLDHAASAGPRGFDLRWVAAETALVRGRIAERLGVFDASFAMLVRVRAPGRGAPAFAARRAGLAGIVVDARPHAPWSVDARLPVAQVLARRWLSLLRMQAADGAPRDAWLMLGVSRYLAQRALIETGAITAAELAADLTMLEGVLALPTHGDRGAELDAMARGALYAARLDARLAEEGEGARHLGVLLMPLLRRAAESSEPLPVSAFTDAVEAALGSDERARFESAVLAGVGRVDVPADAYGPCVRPTRAVHRRFTLGFDAPAGAEGEPFAVAGLVEGGPAHAAGVREGDRVVAGAWSAGDTTREVELTLERDGAAVPVRYAPVGARARGVGWRRAPGIDETECAP